MRINKTIDAFGYPGTEVHDFGEWIVMLRPRQVTLGSLILAAAGPATAFGELSPAAFATLGRAVGRIENVLKQTFRCDKLNYLMLMMVDPHVHFHVIPRYAGPVTFLDRTFADEAWPKPPDVTRALEMPADVFENLRQTLAAAFAA